MNGQRFRVTQHPVLGELPKTDQVHFYVDGQQVTGRTGDVIASALMADGRKQLRRTIGSGAPRSVYCAIGHCFECRVTVDGVPGVRACLQPIYGGMQVETDAGGGVAS